MHHFPLYLKFTYFMSAIYHDRESASFFYIPTMLLNMTLNTECILRTKLY